MPERTDGRMEARTDKQPENIMPPTHFSVGGGIKMKYLSKLLNNCKTLGLDYVQKNKTIKLVFAKDVILYLL